MIVVDTNILAYLYLPGNYTAAAVDLLKRDSDWAAPILWRSEFRNLLAGCLRRDCMTLEHAKATQAEAERLLEGREYDMDSASVLECVSRSNCSAYDCEFAALAIQLNTKLVTMDKKLLADFPGVALSLNMAGH